MSETIEGMEKLPGLLTSYLDHIRQRADHDAQASRLLGEVRKIFPQTPARMNVDFCVTIQDGPTILLRWEPGKIVGAWGTLTVREARPLVAGEAKP